MGGGGEGGGSAGSAACSQEGRRRRRKEEEERSEEVRGVRSIWLEMNERREQSGKRRAIRLYRRRCGVSLSLTLTLYVKVSLSFSLIVVLRVRIVGLATNSCQLRKPQNDTDSGQDLITHTASRVLDLADAVILLRAFSLIKAGIFIHPITNSNMLPNC